MRMSFRDRMKMAKAMKKLSVAMNATPAELAKAAREGDVEAQQAIDAALKAEGLDFNWQSIVEELLSIAFQWLTSLITNLFD